MSLGVSELFRVAKNEATRVFSTTPLFIAGIFYLSFNLFPHFSVLQNIT